MKNYPNLESTSWKKTTYGQPIYVGYGGGFVWHVMRSITGRGYHCRTVGYQGPPGAFRDTLREISAYLASFDGEA